MHTKYEPAPYRNGYIGCPKSKKMYQKSYYFPIMNLTLSYIVEYIKPITAYLTKYVYQFLIISFNIYQNQLLYSLLQHCSIALYICYCLLLQFKYLWDTPFALNCNKIVSREPLINVRRRRTFSVSSTTHSTKKVNFQWFFRQF